MRKYLALICLTLLFGACTKEETTPSTSTDGSAMDYTINGVYDIKIDSRIPFSLPLEIRYESGTQEKVFLSTDEFPYSMGADFTNDAGIPSFGTIMRFYFDNTMPGVYPVKIIGTTESGKQKSWKMSITVK